MGFATDVAPPADFVAKIAPESEPDYIPVFQPPPEPARPVLKTTSSRRSRATSTRSRSSMTRSDKAFPPSAKAMAEQQAAAKKAKSKPPAAQQ